ncbi:MAG: hypothetical protein JOZ72_00700 [Alphaproteobacteria bacterium]|nr:hypothetical protein [Alphaproteobacteria bacterium]
MIAKFSFSSRVAAVLLGAAALAFTAGAADAAVRSQVGKPLQEAQSLAASGNYSAAMAKVHQAEGVGGLTPEESRVVAQMRAYIQARQSGGGDGSPKGKFASDYRAGRWSSVIADADALHGSLDATEQAAVATAYYKLGRNAECVRYIKSHFGPNGSDTVLRIQMACAFGAGDDEAQTSALETLVSRTQSPELWDQLLKSAERTRGLNDHQTLDIYRIKMRTTTMAANDYTMLAKLCLEFGFAAEAQAVQQKGLDAKLLSGNSADRLMAMTKQQVASGQAGWGARMAAANKAPNGDALIKAGEDLWGQGKFKDAVDTIQAGIKKDKTDMNEANTRLGMAYLGNGQKDAAIKAFNQVKDNPKQELAAKLWSLYARK